MSCEAWTEQIDAYLDGERSTADARALNDHLRVCAACAAQSLSRVQQKRAVHAAGLKYTPDPAFRARIQKSVASPRPILWKRLWLPVLAGAMALLIAGAISLSVSRNRAVERQTLGELADLHVATLASSNPVDVVSTDRHTVKPWYQGKIPFTFNLPELQDSPFTLVGGKVSYFHQSPGAELIFRVRQHQISVFIFQEQAVRDIREGEVSNGALSFTARSWRQNGLRYFVIGDAAAQDLDKLSELLKSAA